MAKPRKSAKVLEMSGAFDKNPKRRRSNEPEPKAGIGAYPKRSTDPAVCWDQIVGSAPPGVLGDCDRAAMQIAADLMAKHNGEGLKSGELSQLIRLLCSFGLTPTDRARLSVPAPPDDDGWGDL